MPNEKPIRMLPELVRTKFRFLCKPENMVEFEAAGDEYGTRKYRLQDNFSGYRIIHHFTCPPSDRAGYDSKRDMLQRRMDRLYANIQQAKHALLVLNTVFPYDPALLKPIYEAFRETFPETEIEIYAMQFAAGRNGNVELENGQIRVACYERPLNIVYDNQFTAPEWAWMDQVKVKGLPLPEQIRKKKLIIKWAYKLWRTLGKFLENRNAGCVNMRFFKFDRY